MVFRARMREPCSWAGCPCHDFPLTLFWSDSFFLLISDQQRESDEKLSCRAAPNDADGTLDHPGNSGGGTRRVDGRWRGEPSAAQAEGLRAAVVGVDEEAAALEVVVVGPRVIDLDVLMYGREQRQEPGATSTSGLASQVEKLEKEMITEALRQTRGNQSKAATLLDTSLRILGYKIKQYGIETRGFRAA